MRGKILKSIGLFIVSLIFTGIIFVFEVKEWPVGSSLSGIALGFALPALFHSLQDWFDTTDWKVSLRKLKRGKFVDDNTIVRISFAYLYRIKVGNKYLLVPNKRGTGKFQPVGGVYKFYADEATELKNRFHVMDDNKISIDESSRDDYRLRLEIKYLRKFVNRFNRKACRENIENLGREFNEELVETGIVNWDQIRYRVCGRHMTEVKYGEHFQMYELLLADIVELLPTKEQEKDLQRLAAQTSESYKFYSAHEIDSLGVDTEACQLQETVADHTKKILQENESQLMKVHSMGNEFTVHLR